MCGKRLLRNCATNAVRALHRTCELNSRSDIELPEDVAEMRLDGLLAEEELRGDFWIRLAVDDEPCDLVLALSQQLDVGPVGVARVCAAVDVMSQLSQFAFRLISVAQRTAFLELAGRALELGGGTVTLAGLGEGAGCERA